MGHSRVFSYISASNSIIYSKAVTRLEISRELIHREKIKISRDISSRVTALLKIIEFEAEIQEKPLECHIFFLNNRIYREFALGAILL